MGDQLLQPTLAKELNELYVDYFNNFLTIQGFADHYGFSDSFAKKVIECGRKINHNDAIRKAIYNV